MSEGDFQTTPIGISNSTEKFQDVSIRCMDCAQDFVWTIGEQAFFHDKNLLNPPKRCKECKKEKNRRLEAVVMNHLTGKRHKIEVRAECAKCSTVSTVPFYPSQGRPVYCRSCFLDMNAGNGNGAKNGSCG